MFNLFNDPTVIRRGQSVVPEFNYLKQGMAGELDKVVHYYQSNVTAVKSSHPLVSLLNALTVPHYSDYNRYVYTVRDSANRWTMSLKWTSSMSQGGLKTPGVFYGDATMEAIIAVEDEFDIDDAVKNWRTLRPIRVLSHPFADTNFGICNGNYQSRKTGLAVIAVNIPMLALQYRLWQETEKGYTDGSDRNTQQFVAMYPIPNMLYSHMDICVFNRLISIFNNEPLEVHRHIHPFYVINYEPRLDTFLRQQLDVVIGRALSFDILLTHFPMISADWLGDTQVLPPVVRSRQVNWALILARLPLIKFLLKYNDVSKSHLNKPYLNKIEISLLRLKYDNTLMQSLPVWVAREIESDIERSIVNLL